MSLFHACMRMKGQRDERAMCYSNEMSAAPVTVRRPRGNKKEDCMKNEMPLSILHNDTIAYELLTFYDNFTEADGTIAEDCTDIAGNHIGYVLVVVSVYEVEHQHAAGVAVVDCVDCLGYFPH